MVGKMYTVMDAACEKISKFTGVSIRFPRPGKCAWKVSAIINGSIGTGLLLLDFYLRINGFCHWVHWVLQAV